MNIASVIVAAVPGIEARGASAYMICSGNAALIPLAVFMNFIGVITFITLLESGRFPERIERFAKNKADRFMKKAESWFSRYGGAALLLLIALPSTGIGSYTGAFIGRILGLQGRIFYVVILLAIALSLPLGMVMGYLVLSSGFQCP